MISPETASGNLEVARTYGALPATSDSMFHQLFERSADAIFLFDPAREVFVDCNDAAVQMMRASSKEELLMVHPATLSPEFQPDGKNSREKTTEVVSRAISQGGYRFEWHARRMDGAEFPLEVLLTPIERGEYPLMATVCRDITERKVADAALRESEQKFRQLFEASCDAIQILDPVERRMLDCNAATVRMVGGGDKNWLLNEPIDSLSPERQPDGRTSRDAGRMWTERALTIGPQRFEWLGKRHNGEEFPCEVLLTPIRLDGRQLLVSVSREISERKKNERELRELNQSLERRVAERTAALTASEARFRALVEHAPEAIVVYSVDEGRFLFGNQHACDLYGVSMSKLRELTPEDVSPEFQPGGRRTSDLVREKTNEVLTGGISVFEWVHKQSNGRLIPTEVRLLRLPAEGQTLIRASLIDNTERKRAELALRESEEKFRALFERSSQGIVLHDEDHILEVNPAAVRILGCESPEQIVGKHPADTSPPFQPNGESSSMLARKYIRECMETGSARFDWLSQTPDRKKIPIEVTLTRIQWSGRQVIQALISDISERKKAEAELRASEARLRESEARFSAAFNASPVFITVGRMDDGQYVLANEAFLKWTDYKLDDVLGHTSLELGLWADPSEREPFWDELRRMGSIRERECRTRDRHGKLFTMLVSADVIEINSVPHLLTVGLDITERKEADAALRASEARLRESEALFSAAFEASPILIVIARMSDQKYVLVNDAFVNWSGCEREELLGRDSTQFGLWESQDERNAVWAELQRSGSIRERECHFRNRRGERSTMLISFEAIQINDAPHLLAMGLDITRRKQAEEESRASEARLRESEARFSAAFHSSPIITGITRARDGRFVLVNDAALDWFGCTREEVLGKTAVELGVWDSWEDRERFWDNVRCSGSVRQWECRLKNLRDHISTMLASGVTIEINGEEHRLIMMVDITERKKTEANLRASEARLRESEARFSAAFHASPIITAISRASDGKFVLANDAFLNWAGYERDEVLGRTAMELGIWENSDERKRFWDEVRTAGSVRAREYKLRNRRGRYTTMLASGVVIAFQGEDHLLGIMLDITQRKQAEAELHRALARELELNELKSNFVSMVSHEFRTPLGIIQSSAELLRDFYERMESAERAEQLDSITRNTRRMAAMMEEILILSRLDAGKLDFKPAALDLDGFFRRVVDEVLSATNRRCPIELTVNEIPVAAQADERLLGHIFTNLLSNAVKYSEAGATVSMQITREEKQVVCVVQDHGIGISEDDQQQLFKAFHRGSNVGSRPGTGLGLLLVKRCAELHGGEVFLKSKVGEGTSVTITIPAFSSEP